MLQVLCQFLLSFISLCIYKNEKYGHFCEKYFEACNILIVIFVYEIAYELRVPNAVPVRNLKHLFFFFCKFTLYTQETHLLCLDVLFNSLIYIFAKDTNCRLLIFTAYADKYFNTGVPVVWYTSLNLLFHSQLLSYVCLKINK